MELIPAIDIIDGQCVRLSQGDYARSKTYYRQPLDAARMFEDAGLRRLHVVDLDGAKAQHIVNAKALESICGHTSLTVDFGGGIKSDEDVKQAFDCGAAMVTGGSVALRHEERFVSWIERYGSQRIILGADARVGRIAVNGWQEDTSQELIPYLKDYMTKGVSQTVCTDIGRDGMLAGPAVELYREILVQCPGLYLIASGGVSSVADLEALEAAGLPAVIFGKALYEGRIQLPDLQRFLC